jgi:hypothetical protein
MLSAVCAAIEIFIGLAPAEVTVTIEVAVLKPDLVTTIAYVPGVIISKFKTALRVAASARDNSPDLILNDQIGRIYRPP